MTAQDLISKRGEKLVKKMVASSLSDDSETGRPARYLNNCISDRLPPPVVAMTKFIMIIIVS